jgi:hypothetical protein
VEKGDSTSPAVRANFATYLRLSSVCACRWTWGALCPLLCAANFIFLPVCLLPAYLHAQSSLTLSSDFKLLHIRYLQLLPFISTTKVSIISSFEEPLIAHFYRHYEVYRASPRARRHSSRAEQRHQHPQWRPPGRRRPAFDHHLVRPLKQHRHNQATARLSRHP